MANARLRKHLQREGSDAVAQQTPQQNFCLIGTPLPALNSKQRDENEFKPVWEQEVRDEEGRQRFHGAFTGGFSAGYYNTVGSKEGWVPSTFRSSRKDKAKAAADASAAQSKSANGARPEDFMDEEDLADLQQARELQNSKGYDAPGASRDPLGGSAQVEDLAEAFSASILPSSSSIGVTLLKRMGWREGTGIGPRVSAARRRALRAQLGLAPSKIDGDDDDDAADDEGEAAKHTYPPPDTPLAHVLLSSGGGRERSNEDLHGLGWQGGATLEDALRRARSENTAKTTERPGFGIGALEYDSDEDAGAGVYATGDDIRESTLGRAERRKPIDTVSQKVGVAKADRAPEAAGDRWKDGSMVLAGFHISVRQQPDEPWFSAEPIPPNWKPNPRRIWQVTQPPPPLPTSGGPPGPPPPLPSHKRPVHSAAMRAEDRSALLGEARIPGPPPSILDYLSRKDRERIEAIKNGGSLPSPESKGGANVPDPEPVPADVYVPSTDPRTASAALQGFMPYTADAAKASRYRAYLMAQRDASVDSPAMCPSLAPGQTREQLAKELADFAKSAAIFRPLSTAMAGRFTSARSEAGAGDGVVVTGGLYQPPPKPPKEKQKPAEKEAAPGDEQDESQLPPAVRAAQRGEFGSLTRVVSSFFPHRLLCKRFNVPDPQPDRASDGDATQQASAAEAKDAGVPTAFGKEASAPRANEQWNKSRRAIEQLAHGRAWEGAGMGPAAAGTTAGGTGPAETNSKTSSVLASLENVGLGEDERQGADTLSYTKPGMDIFKAVFADDESDDEDEPVKDAALALVSSVVANAPEKTESRTDTRQEQSIAAPASFRPTFVPRSQRRTEEEHDEDEEMSIAKPASARPRIYDDEEVVIATGPARLVEEEEALRRKAARKSEDGKKEKEKRKREKDKKKGRTSKGMLTFDLDDEEGGDAFVRPNKKRTKHEAEGDSADTHKAAVGPLPASAAGRPKAADMF